MMIALGRASGRRTIMAFGFGGSSQRSVTPPLTHVYRSAHSGFSRSGKCGHGADCSAADESRTAIELGLDSSFAAAEFGADGSSAARFSSN
jgi:hypothetical protein